MTLFSHWYFWLKNWHFSTSSCKVYCIHNQKSRALSKIVWFSKINDMICHIWLIMERILAYCKTNIQKHPPSVVFIQKVQNSLQNNCVGVLSFSSQSWKFIKKETPVRALFCWFWEIFKITVFIKHILGCFWNILFILCPYYEAEIKSSVLPLRKQNKGNLK